jgi:hypothetical protein
MALLKQTILPSGFTAEYWKIVHCELNTMEKSVTVVMSLFKDRNVRLVNGRAVDKRVFTWQDANLYAEIANMKVLDLISLIYSRIKLDGNFANAQDILEQVQ